MAKNIILTDETEITFKKGIPAYEYRDYFRHVLKLEIDGRVDLGSWFMTQEGKTLKEAAANYNNISNNKTMKAILSESVFDIITKQDKDFIIALTEYIGELGYDFGSGENFKLELPKGSSYKHMIVYGKTGTKSRPCPARIYIECDGKIRMRLFLYKIDNHRQYIENAPAHIKDVFTNENGKCNGCSFKDGKCKYKCTKTYTIDGRLFHKCGFMLTNPSEENLPDYMGLLKEFYLPKRSSK